MKTLIHIANILLDALKRVLVRFKNAKFGLLFFIDIFKIPDFILDKRVNILSKFKLVFALAAALFYIVSSIDIIPEMITGAFGFIDDIFVIVWSLGIAIEEIEKYKKMIEESKDPRIIDNVNYSVKDEEE